MNPCADKKEQIAWLAINAQDDAQAQALREHFKTCPNCKAYYDDMAGVTGILATAQPDQNIQATSAFHGRLVKSIETTPQTRWNCFFWLHANWTPVFSLAACTGAIALVCLFSLFYHSQPSVPLKNEKPFVTSPVAPPVLAHTETILPTFQRYQCAMRQSPEALDQMLNRDAKALSASQSIPHALKLSDLDLEN